VNALCTHERRKGQRLASDQGRAHNAAVSRNFAAPSRLMSVAAILAARARGGAFHERSGAMSILISVLITFVVVILVLYLVNMLPLDGRAKQIVQIIVIIIGILSLLKYLAVY
jgi:hypothetical protein